MPYRENMKGLSTAFFASLIVAGSLVSSAAQAVDRKITAGNQCHGRNAAAESNMTHWWDYLEVNNGTQRVVCPVVRDRTSNPTGTVRFFVHVHVPQEETVSCTLYSGDRFNTFVRTRTGMASAGVDAVDRSINLNLPAGVTGGAYTVQCAVPENGRVYGIRIDEFEDTNSN